MPNRAKTYDETFDEEEKRAVEGMKRARHRADYDRYQSDLNVVQAMRRRHARGEFPRVKRLGDDD